MKPDTGLAPDDRQRGFWYLFVTQFQGAFSDNALKWLAIFVITGLGLSNENDAIPKIGRSAGQSGHPFLAVNPVPKFAKRYFFPVALSWSQ